MVALIKAAQLLLSLSILVVLHELGHYWAARAFKTRVEKFYLFMNPGFSLFKKQIGETEWGIGWLPLGGYVKISGMIDESMDKEQMKLPPQPWEFRSKPAWQRLIIMLGGIIINLILGFAIYSMVLNVWGDSMLPADKIPYGLEVDDRLKPLGFEDGDQVLTINGETPESFKEIRRTLFFDHVSDVQVERNGSIVGLQFNQDLGQFFVDSAIRQPFGLRVPCLVDRVAPGSGAAAGGLQSGDRFISIDGESTRFYGEVTEYLQSHPSKMVTIEVLRMNGTSAELLCNTDSMGALGFDQAAPNEMSEFQMVDRTYTLGQSLTSGFTLAWTTLEEYVLSMRFLFSKSGASQVGSLVTFGSIFDAGWDWEIFWRNTAFFSLILAFMNLLPIPALDGGHVMFLLYEMIVGRPASEKFLEYAQTIGIVLLLGLMALALGNDIWRVITGQFG
ncbi:MAG: RIP metalloprotease RseP [Crocinitomicaceae bacterium]|nr:RIP metalloprotease RseP [Crocinitomicaceae bacterium]